MRRMIKMAKYLARQDVEVHFITTNNARQINNYEKDILDERIHVVKIPSLAISNYLQSNQERLLGKLVRRIVYYLTMPLFFIDYATLWAITLLPYCWWYMRKHDIRYVYVSGPPFSTVWHMALLKKVMGQRMTLIAEWRDLWIEDKARLFLWPKKFFRFVQSQMEKLVLRQADLVITVTQQLTALLSSKVSGNTKVFVLENGYDQEDFQITTPIDATDNRNNDVNKEIRKLIYTGNIVGTRGEGLFLLLNALNVLMKRDIKAVLQIVGTVSYPIKARIEKEYLPLIRTGYLQLVGVVAPLEAISAMQDANYGVVIVQRDHPEALTSKFFEYCAVAKTLLCVGPKGELQKKVENMGLGLYVTLDDKKAIDKIVTFLTDQKQVTPACFAPIQKQNSFAGIANDFLDLIRKKIYMV